MKKTFLTELVGWYGVIALLGAYAAVSFGYLTSGDILFQVLNVTGALGIVIDALAQKNWQPVVLNIVWGTVAIVSLIRILS